MKKQIRRTICALHKPILSTFLALTVIFSAFSGLFPLVGTVNATNADSANVYCNVKYTKPAICCDEGDVIDLTQCGVQFSASSAMVTSGITWTYNGASVTSFTPSAKGVYTLVASDGTNTKNVYVVAKKATETEYVLYRNDFDAEPTDFTVIQAINGASVYQTAGQYILDCMGNADAYARVLLPAFLDDFGDVKIRTDLVATNPTSNDKWGAVMYRIQNVERSSTSQRNYPYYQTAFRYDMENSNGVEIAERNSYNGWSVCRTTDFSYYDAGKYSTYEIDLNGTETVISINGLEVMSYANTKFATGAFGFHARGNKFQIDYVEFVLDGNDEATTTCDVSYAKPAIRADMGDTIDLTNCDVQFAVDTLYTPGEDITWKKDGSVITSFTPAAPGVTALTATSGGVTKDIYVVTRDLSDGEYVLYYNDFSSAPTDFRTIQELNGSTAYWSDTGHYVLDGSGNTEGYVRVLLPEFLDDFGDMKLEARIKESSPYGDNWRNWSGLMARVQNNDNPYVQMTVRYTTKDLADGVELAERVNATTWSVKAKAEFDDKSRGEYNTYSLAIQSNHAYGYIDNEKYAGTSNTSRANKVVSYDQIPYVTGAMGFQVKALKAEIDYVKVTLGETTAKEDTSVTCTVSKTMPMIGCNIGQTINLSECDVQLVYGSRAVDGKYIEWKDANGNVITEFSATTGGRHKLTATHGDMTMDVYVVPKTTSGVIYQIFGWDFSTVPTDFRVVQEDDAEAKFAGGYCQLVCSTGVDRTGKIRLLLPEWLDAFGEGTFEAGNVGLFAAYDNDLSAASLIYRVQDAGVGNANEPYYQAIARKNTTLAGGVEISRVPANSGTAKQTGSTAALNLSANANTLKIEVSGKTTVFSVNNNVVLTETNTLLSNGAWGLQTDGVDFNVKWLRLYATKNNTNTSIYIVPGEYLDVRDPETGMNVAPSLITEVKTAAEFEIIATDTPAIAIMKYDVIDGQARIVFEDGTTVSPEDALGALGGRIIPAFRVDDNTDADSLALFLRSKYLKDAYVVSTTPSVVNRAYQKWKYVRGVIDYSASTDFDAETIRAEALANGARVLLLGEKTSKDVVTQLQDSYSCVWLAVGEGKTASVTAINKGPYGIVTPNRVLTEECYENASYYGENTIIRRVNAVGHRGNTSVEPKASENTIDSAVKAYDNGATMVEIDVHLSSDGVLMVVHNEEIVKENVTYVVDELTHSELKNLGIPYLEEYFSLLSRNPQQKLVIELKCKTAEFTENFIAPLETLLNRYPGTKDQIVLISFYESHLAKVRQELPGVAVGYLNGLSYNELDPMVATMNTFEHIQSYNGVTSPNYNATGNQFGSEVVKALVYRGVNLWPWTVNTQSQFEHLMFAGVGGITTDYSQWSNDFIEELYVNDAGKVIATKYDDTVTYSSSLGYNVYTSVESEVTSSVEFVLLEDTIGGVTWSNGTLNVPQNGQNGKVSYFFRYRATSPNGTQYYVVSEVQTYCKHVTQEVPGKPATCTETGLTAGEKCTICGEFLVAQQVQPALGHKMSYIDQGNGTHRVSCERNDLPVTYAIHYNHNGACICGFSGMCIRLLTKVGTTEHVIASTVIEGDAGKSYSYSIPTMRGYVFAYADQGNFTPNVNGADCGTISGTTKITTITVHYKNQPDLSRLKTLLDQEELAGLDAFTAAKSFYDSVKSAPQDITWQEQVDGYVEALVAAAAAMTNGSDATVKNVELLTGYVACGKEALVRVTTGGAVSSLYLTVGGTQTELTRCSAYVNQDGTKTWLIQFAVSDTAGSINCQIYANDAGGDSKSFTITVK